MPTNNKHNIGIDNYFFILLLFTNKYQQIRAKNELKNDNS